MKKLSILLVILGGITHSAMLINPVCPPTPLPSFQPAVHAPQTAQPLPRKSPALSALEQNLRAHRVLAVSA